jgi:UDP-N-acetylmuramoyl-tripeptide--D-alanyl-D-alanine ligase
VDNTRRALLRLAEGYRTDFDLPVIAVAGSNGKTTTKELIAAVLRQKLGVLWSEGSFNNDIGVPLTLLRLERTHQAAVLEAGTNHPGELEPLIRIIRPRYGVITSIGREHLEFFGNREGVAREEGVLAELLPAGGKLWLNGDSHFSEDIGKRSYAPVVKVGFKAGNDWRVRAARLDKTGVTFRIDAPNPAFSGQYRVNLIGRHQALNSAFAIAVAHELGLSRPEIETGLMTCEPAKMRMQAWEANGIRVLDDAYNANADSMIAALETLRGLACRGRRVAVLGDMAELGDHAEAAHLEIGRLAAESGVDQLFAVGRNAPLVARAARAAGLLRVLEFADPEALVSALKCFLKPGDLVLLKASRSMRLEGVAARLRGEPIT